MKNLKLLIAEAGTAAELARSVHKDPAYISQILNERKSASGKPRGVGDKFAAELERAMNKRAGWMDAPHNEVNELPAGYSNITPGPPIQGKLPLLSWVQAGDATAIIDRVYHEGDSGIEMIPVLKTGGPYSFCLRVKGDSMMATEGKHSFPDGIVIQVDPDVPAQNESFVIARFCDTNEATFKQLMIDGGHKYLKPLNPRYPVINCNSNIEILGVVFGAIYVISV